MDAAKVYFGDMRCKVFDSLLNKMTRILDRAGVSSIDFKQKFVAIKIHFGEPGNLSYLRPNFAKTLADKIKLMGGKPFLTDCNTLYTGRRNNALVHMDAAFENGYSPFSTGVQNIIADGLKGTDEVEVPVRGGIYCKTALIGRAIMDADILLSLNHFKGHELAGFGGAIKNVGMGSGSRAGKMVMHCDGKPEVVRDRCTGCRSCVRQCNQNAISFVDKKARIDENLCVGCGRCIGACNFNAIENNAFASVEALNSKMAEYAKAVLDERPNFHINIVNQVSPCCDCHPENDAAVVPDIGIFASFDPVALDKACIDAVNAAPTIRTSVVGERENGRDLFGGIHPVTDWRTLIAHAERIGLGTSSYELISVE
ncbi:MAG: DUF362 domain-containing protein [Helicobacteraceae bacterium]|jgi:uncharacterized Fe-S center protein|nr:DUF362 domain-containing protein [Helicobacteraceae bacterium]